MKYASFLFITLFYFTTMSAAQEKPGQQKFLIHVTTGQDNPTKAALSFLVAKTALEEGHQVNLFLAGDAVLLLKDEVLNAVTGLGTGKLSDHYKVIVEKGGKFYLSGNSSKARNLTEEDLKGKPASFALPNVLVKLVAESDKVITY
ncbi:MAG: DsrE family protein [Chitinophagaceae bacterium]|nr:DsrE family protein [Chitinophagaceae bacterium]MCA6514878.1 DsrE family protein [Chitinophagaceae bacterium]